MSMILIAAMASDRVIGAGSGMPWSVPAEYAHFLSTVRGETVLMGRRTYEIFGPDLEDSQVLVLSRSVDALADARVVTSLDEAVREAQTLTGTLFVAGGASVYRLALPHADAMHLSIIEGDYDGDAYFPEFDESEWTIKRREPREGYVFVEYRRAISPSATSPSAPSPA